MRTRLSPPSSASVPQITNRELRAPDRSGRPRLRGYVRILGLGLAAVVYLGLVVRAAELDSQVGEVEKELAEARFDLLRAKQEFYDRVCAVSVAEPPVTDGPAATTPAPEPPEKLRVSGLPRLAPSVLGDAAGWGALARVTPAADAPGTGTVRLAQTR